MGEAKRREEVTGERGLQKIYAESDLCPACGKTIKSMDTEHNGKILTAQGIFVICSRCGNLFLPPSKVKTFFASGDRKIVDPKSPEGQAIQQAASKIVLPGAK